MDFSPVQLLIVLAIILLVFGAKKLPEIGRNLGSGAREFKEGITGQGDKADGQGDKADGQGDKADGEAISGPAAREDEKVG